MTNTVKKTFSPHEEHTCAQQNQVASFAYEDIAVWAAATIGKASVNPGDKSQGKPAFAGIFLYN